MAARKKTTTRKKPQYVRAKKRKGAASGLVAQRTSVLTVLVLLIAIMILGMVEGFKWIGRKLYSGNDRFEMQHLIVSCDGKLSEDFIRETAGISEGTNLFAFSFSDLEEKLEGVSRIESVFLERRLPNTLIMKVKERVPVAQIIGRRQLRAPWMVDRYGYVLPHRTKLSTLPVVKGLDVELKLGEQVTHSDVEIALKIIGMVDESSYLKTYIQLDSIDLKYSDYIYLYLRNGIRAKIPRYSLEPRLHKLASTIKIAAARGQRVKTADVTLDSAKVPTTFY